MITYNREKYTRLALERLLASCDAHMRVWVWHNGGPNETLQAVKEYQSHPNFHHLHVSDANKKLREPTNWFWRTSDGRYLSKVDDDCLVPDGWGETLRRALDAVPEFGIIGSWRFYEEDFRPEAARKKIIAFEAGHRLMAHCFVQGSGYVMKRAVVDRLGCIRPNESFVDFCRRAAVAGWINGWYFPFIHEEHMDDARSPYFAYPTEESFRRHMPLSAINNGIASLEEWRNRSRWMARHLQEDRMNPRNYFGWRNIVRKVMLRVGDLSGRPKPWRTLGRPHDSQSAVATPNVAHPPLASQSRDRS
jgi:GT2 family glycosyltransferase